MTKEDLAKAVLAAAKLREMSFNKEAADAVENRININYKQFYKIQLEDACEECAPAGMAGLICLALENAWGDTLNWAESTLRK